MPITAVRFVSDTAADVLSVDLSGYVTSQLQLNLICGTFP